MLNATCTPAMVRSPVFVTVNVTFTGAPTGWALHGGVVISNSIGSVFSPTCTGVKAKEAHPKHRQCQSLAAAVCCSQ
jgi:hypothetical protein